MGNDDPRSQEEREIDHSFNSPASQTVKEASVISGEDTIKIEKEPEPEESIEITDSSPEQDKNSSSSSSSTSSRSHSGSDDESRETEKRDDTEVDEVILKSLSKQAILVGGNAPCSVPSANTIIEDTGPVQAMVAAPNSREHIQMENISEKASVVSVVDTVVSNEDEEKSLPIANENSTKDVSGAIDSDAKEDAGKTLPVSDPIPETNGVPEGLKVPEVSMSHQKEVPVPSPLRIGQRTSWLSCCGLFDVITGSRV
ncbi:PREDICTED: uncharacterized protein LOC104812838 isoform X2 [Tarenaya hassleriana]|uniref:uncharacterized protein LOC104812838 isoform X2 n=1 Tax=Tarenaya hassleriana TaxID=28532 RepID=UPI00053C3CEC|nr:PREDICTED: uncharacterized protein LOC104812838 isoform X2 [Tarenaya hassleriana]